MTEPPLAAPSTHRPAGSDPSDLPGLAAALVAEQARTSLHVVGSRDTILLERGDVPLGTATAPLPPSNRARQWADERADDPGSPMWIGWPLVVGHRRAGGSDREVHAALFVAPATLRPGSGSGGASGRAGDPGADAGRGLVVGATGRPVINDAALELLGVPADERHLLHRELDPLLADGAALDALLAILDRRGLAPGTRRDGHVGLAPVDHARSVSATALAWVSRIDRVPDLAARHADLLALAAEHAGSAGGPSTPSATESTESTESTEPTEPPVWTAVLAALGAEVGAISAVDVPVIEPQPALVPISRAQEQVVAASRERSLTVAVGLAGAGKSQTVLHTALASVAAGERALVIAPDRRLAAALHEQLRSVHPGAFPLLTLGARSRAPLARAIDRALRHPVDHYDDPELAEAAWSRAAGRIRPAYARRAARVGNERARSSALAEQRRLADALRRLLAAEATGDPRPEAAPPDDAAPIVDPSTVDHARLTAVLPDAQRAVHTWGAADGRGPRDRLDRRAAHRQARRAVEPLLATVEGDLRARWKQAIERDELTRVVEAAELVDGYLTRTATVAALQTELDGRPDDEVLGREIDASYAARTGPSVSRSRARWATCLQDRGPGRVPARRFQMALADHRSEVRDASAAVSPLRIEPEMLEAFPLWVATPEGASAFLPLVADLFDLVIVDDADALDAGRGLPALARAHRAVLVGRSPDEAPPVDGDRAARSLLSAAIVAAATTGAEVLALDPPYRPAPPVATYISEHLIPAVPTQAMGEAGRPGEPSGRAPSPTAALTWLDHQGGFVPGPGDRSGRNAGEAIAVVELVAEILAEHRAPEARRADADTIELRDLATEAVAVVAPLSAHGDSLRDALRERFGGRVTVAGFDELAGLERDVIVCSLAVGPTAPDDLVAYATDPAALGSMLRRARVRAVFVGDRTWFGAGSTALAPLARTAPPVHPAALAHRAAG